MQSGGLFYIGLKFCFYPLLRILETFILYFFIVLIIYKIISVWAVF